MNPSARTRGPRLALLMAVGLFAASADAQLVTLELSYSNPGARSMGFGGAFVGLADDATAAFANPSGLTQLTRPEVSAEGRRWSYSTPYTAGGRASGEPSGFGIDTDPELRFAESNESETGLSYLAVVYPTGDWSVAVYRHQLASFRFSTGVNGLFAEAPEPEGVSPGFAGTVRDQDVLTSFDLEIVTWGISAAYRVTENLSIGLGVTYFDPWFLVISDEFLPDDDSMESYFAVGSYLPGRLEKRDRGTVTNTDWGLSTGFLWRVSPRWHLGGGYRQGPDFEGLQLTDPNPDTPGIPGSLFFPISLPDVYSLGASFRSANERLIVALEWDRVEYSTIIDSLPRDVGDPDSALDDASELHFGAEYAFLDATPVIALRLGAWLDPDHRIRYTGTNAFERAKFQPGDDEIHLAAGVGLAFARLQLDVGVELSAERDTVSISAIKSF